MCCEIFIQACCGWYECEMDCSLLWHGRRLKPVHKNITNINDVMKNQRVSSDPSTWAASARNSQTCIHTMYRCAAINWYLYLPVLLTFVDLTWLTITLGLGISNLFRNSGTWYNLFGPGKAIYLFFFVNLTVSANLVSMKRQFYTL